MVCVGKLIVYNPHKTAKSPSALSRKKTICASKSSQRTRKLQYSVYISHFAEKRKMLAQSDITPILFTMSDVCAKIRVTLWQRFLMDHRMEERERRTAADAAMNNHQRPNRPSQEQWPKSNEDERATLCPLRIQGDDC